jgi:ABC-2 type transport system ATP-binding protein
MKPDEGRICVFGLSPHLDQIKVRLRTGYVSGNPQFYAGPTVKQVLQFAAHFYQGWNADRSYRVLAHFGIHPDSEIECLSKGDRVKLALASATGHQPSLLLLDEPASGLDPAARSDILRFVQHLSRREHVSVLLSAEAAVDLEPAAERELVLNDGRAPAPSATLRGKA